MGAKASIQATPTINVGTTAAPLAANVSTSDDGMKVVISVPDAHWAFVELSPFNELSGPEVLDPKSQLQLGKRNWMTSCKAAGLDKDCRKVLKLPPGH